MLVGVLAHVLSRFINDAPNPVVDWWGYTIVVMAAAGSIWLAGERPDIDRLGCRLLAIGIACWAAGIWAQGYLQFALNSTAYPNIADLLYLAFVPFAFLSIGRLLTRTRSLDVGETLDALVVGLAVIAVGSALTLQSNLTGLGTDPFDAMTQLLYPISDIVLLAFVFASVTTREFRLSQRAILLTAGFAVFTVSDALYFVRTMDGTYATGTLLDSMWLIGVLLFSESVWRPGRIANDHSTRRASTVASIVALVAVLAIIVPAAVLNQPLPWFVGYPAAATIVVAVARFLWSAREANHLASQSALARVDQLTGLPNRRALLEHIDDLVAREQAFDLLIIDLDRFKEVNDVLGHHAGDLLLTGIADRFLQALAPGAMLGRLGGDEFGVVTRPGGGVPQAERLRSSLDMPFAITSVDLRVGASVGIAAYPDDSQSPVDALRHADVAMYRAKRTQGTIVFYDAHVDRIDGDRLALASELVAAIDGDQLVIHLQPVVAVDGTIVGAECLVRWQHPRLGLLAPWIFLSIAAQLGLMSRLTKNVLRQSLDAARRLEAIDTGLWVSVNVDAADIADPEFADGLRSALARTGTPPSALSIEITEGAILAEPALARAVVTRLQDAGIQVAIDDFGTGYSSLAYLQNLPVSRLKIDRSFVTGLDDPDSAVAERSRAVVQTIVELAHRLGMQTVAEGVETAEQHAVLTAMGCDLMQGYLFGKPVSLGAFLEAARGQQVPPRAL